MKSLKTIGLWIIVGLLAIITIGTIPSLACLVAAIIAILIAPIEKWQGFLQKLIKKKIKAIIIISLVLIMLITFPEAETPNDTNISDNTTPSTIATTNPTTEHSTTPSNSPSTSPTTIPMDTPTTEPTTPLSTEPAPKPTEPPHFHSFNAATCTAPKTCACGATEGTAKGHNWKDATYTAPKTCSVCEATDGEALDIPGKENYHGHVYTGGSTSKKYHYEANCAGKNSHEITWDEVQRVNLGPCGTCVLK